MPGSASENVASVPPATSSYARRHLSNVATEQLGCLALGDLKADVTISRVPNPHRAANGVNQASSPKWRVLARLGPTPYGRTSSVSSRGYPKLNAQSHRTHGHRVGLIKRSN
jgi:hypothetical protein